MLRFLSPASIAQILYCMESMASDYEAGSADAADYEAALAELQAFVPGVLVDTEDAEALAQNLTEHLQYDGEAEAAIWGPVRDRLTAGLARYASA